MPPKYQTQVTPRFSDFDLQGILNSRQYMDLVGEARVDQMRRCYKTPMEDYVAREETFVMRTFEIDFQKPIYYGSNFSVETWVEEIRGPMAIIKFRFLDSEKELTYASGTAKYFLVSLKTKRPVDFRDDVKKVYLGT